MVVIGDKYNALPSEMREYCVRYAIMYYENVKVV